MLKRIFLLAAAGSAALAGWMWWFAVQPVGLVASPLDFEITPGVGLRAASRQIVDAGVDMPAWQFAWLGRLAGKSAQIKAGSYEVESGVTPWQILEKVARGDVDQRELLLPEGRTFAEFRALVDNHPDIRHDTRGMPTPELLSSLGIDAKSPEGLFFPDTYLFPRNESDLAIYRRAHAAMQKHLDAAWQGRDADLPYKSAYEALIMASLIEKETGNPADREQIAGVFVNRLRAGMLLQTDPAVIYGIEQFDGNLRRRDLRTDTPYNTYLHAGLPPTPIALPGKASLQAALHPARSEMYYFVSRGDGSSEFSRTLDEHNRAVARYQMRRGKSG